LPFSQYIGSHASAPDFLGVGLFTALGGGSQGKAHSFDAESAVGVLPLEEALATLGVLRLVPRAGAPQAPIAIEATTKNARRMTIE